MADEYRAHVGFASGNPGRCGCAVVVTRGDKRAERTTTLERGTAADAAYGAFVLAMTLVADRTSAPIVIVVPSLTLKWIDGPGHRGEDPTAVACRDALAKLRAARPDGCGVSIEMDGCDLSPETQRAMDLAYAAAFPGTGATRAPRVGG